MTQVTTGTIIPEARVVRERLGGNHIVRGIEFRYVKDGKEILYTGATNVRCEMGPIALSEWRKHIASTD